jgi:hypothetical protein
VSRRLAYLAFLPLLAGRVEASGVDDFAAWLPVQAAAQEQTEATSVVGQGFTEIAKTVGKEGLLTKVNILSSFAGVPTALLSGDVDGAMEEAANAALSSGVVFVFSSLGAAVGGPFAPLTGVAGALFGGFVYRQSGIENRIRGHFQRSSDERGSEAAADQLRLRDRLPPIRKACGDATQHVVDARGLIYALGAAGSPVDDLFGEVGETEAAVQALGSRVEGTGFGGVHGGGWDEKSIIGGLADLEWIAGEACRIADQAAATDIDGARRVWETEGRFLGGRIETRSTSVLARIDQAEQTLLAAAAERASQRGEIRRLTAAVDSLAARIQSARESVAGASATLDRAARLMAKAEAPLAECVQLHAGLKKVIERVSLGQISQDGAISGLLADLALINVPTGSHRELVEELAPRRDSLQRSASYLDGFAGAVKGFRASLDRWRGLLSAADAGGFSPAQARFEAEADRQRAETCRARAEALAGLAGSGRAGTQGQADCDRNWPGTVLSRDPVTGTEKCQCPAGTAWSKVSRACLVLPVGTAGGTGTFDGCSHMPGTIRDSRTGGCRCALGTWDATAGRCVDTAAAARVQDVATKQAAAECENLYSRIRVFRLSTDAVGQAAAAEAERGAHARGCDVARIADAKGPAAPPPVGGGTGSGPPAGGGSGTGGGGRGSATCQVTEQPGGAGGFTLVYEQTALGNHFNVYVFTAPKKEASAVQAHWNSQPGFQFVGRFDSYSQGLSAAKKACARRTASTGEAEPDIGPCNCVDEKGKRYSEAFGQPCGTSGYMIRDYNCPSR